MRGDLDHTQVRQSRKTDSTCSVRDKVKEGRTEGDDSAVCGKTVGDSSHSVLTNTKPEVATLVAAESSRGVLEVLGALPSSQVGTGKVGRAAHQFRKDLGELLDGHLRELPAADSGVRGGVSGQSFLPAVGQPPIDTSLQLGGLSTVFLAVRLEQGVPLLLLLVALLDEFSIQVGRLLRDGEEFLRVEAKLLLELNDVVLLKG